MTTPDDDPGARLTRAASQVARQRQAIAADPRLQAWTQAVKHWQVGRLARTHADLLADPGTTVAARFFLDDLYGAKDFSRRDTELLRLLPTMTRLLPDAALHTVADAVELDAISEGFDEAMARELRPDAVSAIAGQAYARAFRATASREQRLHQVELAQGIGRSLQSLVRHPMLGRLLAAMGAPARLAGLSQMHDFLARGFSAFKGLPDVSSFLSRIDGRERALINAIFDGELAPDLDWTSAAG